YINAQATSTAVGDISETKAIHALFGQQKNLYISATKSMTGHLLGAAGAIEAVISIKSISDGIIPATINTEEIDDQIPRTLNIVVKEPIEQKLNVVLSNTFGFGGHNAIIAFKRMAI